MREELLEESQVKEDMKEHRKHWKAHWWEEDLERITTAKRRATPVKS